MIPGNHRSYFSEHSEILYDETTQQLSTNLEQFFLTAFPQTAGFIGKTIAIMSSDNSEKNFLLARIFEGNPSQCLDSSSHPLHQILEGVILTKTISNPSTILFEIQSDQYMCELLGIALSEIVIIHIGIEELQSYNIITFLSMLLTLIKKSPNRSSSFFGLLPRKKLLFVLKNAILGKDYTELINQFKINTQTAWRSMEKFGELSKIRFDDLLSIDFFTIVDPFVNYEIYLENCEALRNVLLAPISSDNIVEQRTITKFGTFPAKLEEIWTRISNHWDAIDLEDIIINAVPLQLRRICDIIYNGVVAPKLDFFQKQIDENQLVNYNVEGNQIYFDALAKFDIMTTQTAGDFNIDVIGEFKKTLGNHVMEAIYTKSQKQKARVFEKDSKEIYKKLMKKTKTNFEKTYDRESLLEGRRAVIKEITERIEKSKFQLFIDGQPYNEDQEHLIKIEKLFDFKINRKCEAASAHLLNKYLENIEGNIKKLVDHVFENCEIGIWEKLNTLAEKQKFNMIDELIDKMEKLQINPEFLIKTKEELKRSYNNGIFVEVEKRKVGLIDIIHKTLHQKYKTFVTNLGKDLKELGDVYLRDPYYQKLYSDKLRKHLNDLKENYLHVIQELEYLSIMEEKIIWLELKTIHDWQRKIIDSITILEKGLGETMGKLKKHVWFNVMLNRSIIIMTLLSFLLIGFQSKFFSQFLIFDILGIAFFFAKWNQLFDKLKEIIKRKKMKQLPGLIPIKKAPSKEKAKPLEKGKENKKGQDHKKSGKKDKKEKEYDNPLFQSIFRSPRFDPNPLETFEKRSSSLPPITSNAFLNFPSENAGPSYNIFPSEITSPSFKTNDTKYDLSKPLVIAEYKIPNFEDLTSSPLRYSTHIKRSKILAENNWRSLDNPKLITGTSHLYNPEFTRISTGYELDSKVNPILSKSIGDLRHSEIGKLKSSRYSSLSNFDKGYTTAPLNDFVQEERRLSPHPIKTDLGSSTFGLLTKEDLRFSPSQKNIDISPLPLNTLTNEETRISPQGIREGPNDNLKYRNLLENNLGTPRSSLDDIKHYQKYLDSKSPLYKENYSPDRYKAKYI